MEVHWKIWFFRGSGTQTKMGGWTVCRLKRTCQKRGGVFSTFWNTKSEESQTKNSGNDCITVEILQKSLSNEWI